MLMNFDLHDKVVHPLHGAGVVTEICRKDISGDMVDCIVIRLVAGRAGILLPFNSIQESGLRRVCSNEDMDEALTVLGNTAEDLPRDWRRRIEVLRERVHSGDPSMIATAVRDVLARSSISKMNPSEKRVFTEAIGVLAGELSLVSNIEFQGARTMIEKRVTGVRKKKKQA